MITSKLALRAASIAARAESAVTLHSLVSENHREQLRNIRDVIYYQGTSFTFEIAYR